MEEMQDLTTTVFSTNNFIDMDINSFLKKELEKHNYTQMTKIQKKAIPVILKHQNVVFKSETGSGKTLAYVVPILEMLDKLNKENKIERSQGTFVLVFAPTHELCLQIEETFNKLRSCLVGVVNGTLLVIVIMK
jgi:superfamily II DNA/RNA helicase